MEHPLVVLKSELSVLAVLIAYLCLSIALRHRAEARRQRALERQWPHEAFDTSAISPQLQRLRRDYVGAVQSRPHHGSDYHGGLLANARRAIIRLSYFRDARAEAPGSTEHETEQHAA